MATNTVLIPNVQLTLEQLIFAVQQLEPAAQSKIVDVIKKNKQPQQKEASAPYPIFGSAKGLISIAPNFDEPLDDFKDYMP